MEQPGYSRVPPEYDYPSVDSTTTVRHVPHWLWWVLAIVVGITVIIGALLLLGKACKNSENIGCKVVTDGVKVLNWAAKNIWLIFGAILAGLTGVFAFLKKGLEGFGDFVKKGFEGLGDKLKDWMKDFEKEIEKIEGDMGGNGGHGENGGNGDNGGNGHGGNGIDGVVPKMVAPPIQPACPPVDPMFF